MRIKVGKYYINEKEFDDYKAWCKENGLSPSHADSSFKYHEKLKRDKFIATHDIWSFGWDEIDENKEEYFDGYTAWSDADYEEVYNEHFDEFVDMLMDDEDLAKKYEAE